VSAGGASSVTREVSQSNHDAPPSQQYVTTTEQGQIAGASGDNRIYVRSIEGVLTSQRMP
jgi:hypothetical protein